MQEIQQNQQRTHYKKLINPDYIGAYSLEPGKDMVVTIVSVKNQDVIGPDGRKEECVVATLKDQKPWILNVTNMKTISKVLGSNYVEDWTGKKVQIFATVVKAFGDMVEAIRVRPFPPKLEKGKLSDSQFKRMVTAIQQGNMTVQDAITRYALTDQQKQQLQ